MSQVDTKRFAAFTKTYPNQAVHSEDTPADTDWKIIHVNHDFLMSQRSHFHLKSTRPSLERCLCLIIRKNNDISQNCNAVTMAISLLNSQYFYHKISVNSVLSDMTEVTLGRFFFCNSNQVKGNTCHSCKKAPEGILKYPILFELWYVSRNSFKSWNKHSLLHDKMQLSFCFESTFPWLCSPSVFLSENPHWNIQMLSS